MKIKGIELVLFEREPTGESCVISLFVVASMFLLMMFLLNTSVNDFYFEEELYFMSFVFAVSTLIFLSGVIYSYYKQTLTGLIEDFIYAILFYMVLIIACVILINLLYLLISFFVIFVHFIVDFLRFLK